MTVKAQLNFNGKLVLITGAAQGMGAAVAKGFAQCNAELVLVDANPDKLKTFAQSLAEQGHKVHAYPLDISSWNDVLSVAEKIRASLGGIDVLINNAGISGRLPSDDSDAVLEVWQQVIQVNLTGTRNMVEAFAQDLKRKQGCIVNFASIVSFVSGSSTHAYIASKGAVRSYTQALARDFGSAGVRVNAVAPGFMMTDMVTPQLEQEGGTDWYMSRAPLKRGGQAEEIVGPVLFLASDLASYVNGVVLPVDGGFLAV